MKSSPFQATLIWSLFRSPHCPLLLIHVFMMLHRLFNLGIKETCINWQTCNLSMTDLFKWPFCKTEKIKKNPSSQPLKHNWFQPTEPSRCLLTHQSTFSHIQRTCPVYYLYLNVGFPCGSAGKESTCNGGFSPWVQSLGWEDPLEKGKATHSSILSWRMPWTVSMGSQRVGHNWETFTVLECATGI